MRGREMHLHRGVNGSDPVQVHGGPGRTAITVKEKIELDADPDPIWNHFLGSETKTINEKMKLEPKPVLYMGQVWIRVR